MTQQRDERLPTVRVMAKAVGTPQVGESKEQRTRFVRVMFEPQEDARTEDGKHGVKAGVAVAWDGWFTEQTVERTIESLKTAGWNGQSMRDFEGVGEKLVSITVEFEQGEKGAFARVAWVNRPGAPPIPVDQLLGDSEIRDLEAYCRNVMQPRRGRR